MVAESRPRTAGAGRPEAVRVIVRCRPLSSTEISQGHQSITLCYPERGVIELKNPSQLSEPSKDFTFDAVYNESSKQTDLYDESFRDLVDSVLNGFNGTIFAYGQTGTGKTYTMEGIPSDRGVIFNCFQHIFDHIAKSKNQQYLVRASYMEIYKEEIRDLLSKDPNLRLELKERPDSGVYVKDLSSFLTKSVEEIHGVMAVGNANRSVGRTNMNEHSSRSHAIFTITVECSDLDAEGECHIRVGKLNLVDLAGSERQAKTGATGERFKEATKINLSLSALGNVISALVDGKSTHIPYRDSKLTRLLQDSLGGNSKTVMVACVGPASYNYEETLGTLRYANRAKNIKNKPRINEDPKDALLREFQEEIVRLRTMLEQRKGKKGIDGRGDDYYRKEKRSIEAERQKIMKDETLVAEERARIMANIEERQKQLEGERRNQARVLKKIQDMESKLLGGVDLIDQTKQQQMELERRRIELAEQKKREREVQQQLEKQEDDAAEIHQTFTNLQQEVEVKTKKLAKLKLKLKKIRIELNDMTLMHSQERRELERDVSEINKELKLKLLIVDNFVPPAIREKIKERATWSEEDSNWNLPGARPLSAEKPQTTENILIGGDDQVVLTRSIGADSGVSFSEPGTSKTDIFEKRPTSNPGLRRPVSAYERDLVSRARRGLSRMQKPSLLSYQPVQPILNEEILRFCGENVLIFSGLERLQNNLKDYDSSNFSIIAAPKQKDITVDVRQVSVMNSRLRSPSATGVSFKKRGRPQRAWYHDKPVNKHVPQSARSRRKVAIKPLCYPEPQSFTLPQFFIPISPKLLDPVLTFRNAIIPKFSCSSSETSESEGICADFSSRDRQSDLSTDEDLWYDRISSRYPNIQNLDHSIDFGEYLLFERRAYSVPRSPMNNSMMNSSYNSSRSSKIPVPNRVMSQSFSVSSSMIATPKRMTRTTQSLTEAMNGSREQLCEPFFDIKSDTKHLLARSRARSLQKQRLDNRWLLEPGDMSRSLSVSCRTPSPSKRLLNRPRVCRTAEEIQAERSTMWLSKLRSEIESFVDDGERRTPDSDVNDENTVNVRNVTEIRNNKRKWQKRNSFGGKLPLPMEKLVRWYRTTHSYCAVCRDHQRISRLSRRSIYNRLSQCKIEKRGVIRRSQCICGCSRQSHSISFSLDSRVVYFYNWAAFFAAVAFIFRLILILFNDSVA